MNELEALFDDQLRTLRTSCRDVLHSLVECLNDRADPQTGIGRLMGAVEIVDELNAINSASPDLARLILQASVAALVNTQTVEAVDGELRRRVVDWN